MDDVQEVKRLVKELYEAPNPQATLDVLKLLKTTVKASEKLLRDTKAGLAVGKLREHDNKEVAALAKELVTKWKTAVKAGKNTPVSPAAASPAAEGSPKTSSTAPQPISAPAPAPPVRTGAAAAIAAMSPTSATSPVTVGPLRTYTGDGVNFSTTGDKTRDKCVTMVYDALASDSNAPAELIQKRAIAIEKTVLADHQGNSTGNYRSKMRSLYLNLKDKSNPALRQSVVSGDIAIPKLTKMTPQDMASEQRKEADRILQEENLFKSLGAKEPEAETSAFICTRCKGNKTRYRQAQTRSADEPMTTFVTCVTCGNRWKFS
ncbi:transcription elongation factor [Auriculariales sp. MPI-PUGE-AT-0066]|nr:transcription elongation factor [Auriculariales sp. MPI-PUGE-AT-0066]